MFKSQKTNNSSQEPITEQNKSYNQNYQYNQNNRNNYSANNQFPQLENIEKISKIAKQELKNNYKNLRKKAKGRPSYPSYIVSPITHIFNIFKNSFKILLASIFLLILFIGGVGSGILFAYIQSTTPIPAELFNSASETSYIYDKNGEVISKQTGALNIDRQYISIDKIKDTYIDEAFISIEDERFISHIGIDPRRIGSAVVSAIFNSGTPTHGGSTITQQVVKLITGNDRRSSQRKIQEWYRAITLDEELTKDEIMELYVNYVPMGNSFIGIESAANGYFGKKASNLTLAEAALLAGLPKAPSLYNPRTENGLRNAFRRQRIVLNKMYELGYISKEELNEARNTELIFRDEDTVLKGTQINSYFTEYALKEALDILINLGYDPKIASQYIQSGGLRIYTSFDKNVQKAVDETFNNITVFQQNPAIYLNEPEKPQAAIVVIDNETGNIAAMAGGYGEKKSNLITNRAVDIRRQPGSSIKPIGVYGPALDLGKMVGSTIIEDEESFFNGKDKPWPTNYDLKYRGHVTFRNAVKGSLNVPAVKVLKEIGVPTAKKYLKDVGIDWTNDPVQLALAVGAPQTGVSPLQMSQAYATFANGGVFRKAHAVTKIEDKNGVVLYKPEDDSYRVYSPQNAYIMTTILEEVTRGITSSFNYLSDAGLFGSVKNGQNQKIATAGKTGTTDSNVDKWFAGFTPYYTAAVWFGFDNRIKQTTIPTPDLNNAIRIWHDAMHRIHLNLAPKEFARPEGIVTKEIEVTTGLLAGNADSNSVMTEYYAENSPLIPTETYKNEDEKDEDSDVSFLDFLRGVIN